MRVLVAFLLICISAHTAIAGNAYMSLRSGEVNMRVGPGKIYPILWTYTTRGLPVRVVGKHNDWIQIQDEASETGWIYSRLLSTTRTAMTATNNVFLHRHPDNNSDVMAKLLKHVVVVPTTCRTTWCNVTISFNDDLLKGWIRKSYLWGIESEDVFEEE